MQLVERDRQAALLDVNLGRGAEPEHILSPFGDGLDVQKMLDAHVFGDGVAAPGAAAEGEGGRELEVIQVADAAEGRRGVDEDAAGLHARAELVELRALGERIEVNGGRVAVAAVGDEMLGLFKGVREVLRAVHGKHRGELLVREFFGNIDALNLADEDFRCLGDRHAGELRDLMRALADDFGVQGAVDDDGLADLFRLFRV